MPRQILWAGTKGRGSLEEYQGLEVGRHFSLEFVRHLLSQTVRSLTKSNGIDGKKIVRDRDRVHATECEYRGRF